MKSIFEFINTGKLVNHETLSPDLIKNIGRLCSEKKLKNRYRVWLKIDNDDIFVASLLKLWDDDTQTKDNAFFVTRGSLYFKGKKYNTKSNIFGELTNFINTLSNIAIQIDTSNEGYRTNIMKIADEMKLKLDEKSAAHCIFTTADPDTAIKFINKLFG